MHLHAFLALVALAASIWLLLRPPRQAVGIAAAVVAAAEVAIAFGFIAIRVNHVAAIGWAVLAVLGVMLFLRQSSRLGGAVCGALLTAAAIPILQWAHLIG